MAERDLHDRERSAAGQTTGEGVAQRVRRATDVKISTLAVALDDVAQRAGGQPAVTPGNQQRRLGRHGKAPRMVELHQVEDGLAGGGVERDLAVVATFADDLKPLAGGAIAGHNVADVKGHELVRAQAGVQVEDNESFVTRAEGRAVWDRREELVDGGRSENTHGDGPVQKDFE